MKSDLSFLVSYDTISKVESFLDKLLPAGKEYERMDLITHDWRASFKSFRKMKNNENNKQNHNTSQSGHVGHSILRLISLTTAIASRQPGSYDVASKPGITGTWIKTIYRLIAHSDTSAPKFLSILTDNSDADDRLRYLSEVISLLQSLHRYARDRLSKPFDPMELDEEELEDLKRQMMVLQAMSEPEARTALAPVMEKTETDLEWEALQESTTCQESQRACDWLQRKVIRQLLRGEEELEQLR
ncbi:hypothetical protein QC762_503975 [Podospora pseudocomata]|uniref:Uncharacterized protein n=1 Tax=Podospora pseudocomata TaxID=2093779 RepID=A0ABR0GB86_9PEZI|nr:hypothetical protein QC762_503975 [Podospora pseudocomata]